MRCFLDKSVLDALDNEIIHSLTEDGRMSFGEMAKKSSVLQRRPFEAGLNISRKKGCSKYPAS